MKKKLVILIGVIILIISSFLFVFIFDKKEEKKNNSTITLNFESRFDELDEFELDKTIKVGWLQVQGTNIDLPVLIMGVDAEAPHDMEYAWRSYNYDSNENREVISGHNYLNVSNNPSTNFNELSYFEGLMAYTYPNFAAKNQYIYYLKDGVEELYVIYGVGFYDNYYDVGESFGNTELVDKYIEKVKNNSLYDYDVEVTNDDELLTLKTCTRYFGSGMLQQFVVDARKVREDEEIIRHEIVTTDTYKELIGEEDDKVDS